MSVPLPRLAAAAAALVASLALAAPGPPALAAVPAIPTRAAATAPGAAASVMLQSVAAVSKSDAWAVGYCGTLRSHRPVIERWNGHRWRVQPSPRTAASALSQLNSVTATSRSSAWAVGEYTSRQEPATPGPGLHVALLGIAAHSASDVWAVGLRASLPNPRTLVQHWNGTTWSVVPSPSPSPHPDALEGVAVLSRAYAWAVGYRGNKTLIERWNGKAWAVQPSPN
ncbi:MAG: hypothetical protein ACRDRJ_05415 [Streptosporangiaceae bacterium]